MSAHLVVAPRRRFAAALRYRSPRWALAGVLLLVSPALLRADADAELAPRRLTPPEIERLPHEAGGAGTSGVTGIQTTVLAGDPKRPGLYTIALRVPAHTRIEAHTHRDPRSASVVAGTWHIGYGAAFDEGALRALPPGSFYTEPAGQAHFARTGAQAVVVYITGTGPTDTVYVAEH